MSAAVPPPGAPAPDADGAARGAGGLGALARLLAAECEAQVPSARCLGAHVRWLQRAALRRVCWVARHGGRHLESAPALTHLGACEARRARWRPGQRSGSARRGVPTGASVGARAPRAAVHPTARPPLVFAACIELSSASSLPASARARRRGRARRSWRRCSGRATCRRPRAGRPRPRPTTCSGTGCSAARRRA